MADEMKQVIVVRKDLKMRKGKIAAQVAHASMKVLLDRGEFGMVEVDADPQNPGRTTKEMACLIVMLDTAGLEGWIKGLFTKVVVGCKDEEELLALAEESQKLGFPTAVITDSGATEFHGVPTKTCVAIGPAHPKAIDEITGHLKLM